MQRPKQLFTINISYKAGPYGPYYEVNMIDPDHNAHVTYVTEGMDNFHQWRDIVNDPDVCWVLDTETCKWKRKTSDRHNEPIVNCDWNPRVLDRLPLQAALDTFYEELQSQ